MSSEKSSTVKRKKEHIDLCLTDNVAFKEKSNGFDKYEFLHNAITEVQIDKINFETVFLDKLIGYPFLISCMTGGTSEAENINARLSTVANELKIPLGVGSQRQALENDKYHKTYKIIRENAPDIPVLGNIGASQIVLFKDFEPVKYLVELVNADAMVIHLNPAQELFQKNGQPNFEGLIDIIKDLVEFLPVPVFAKEVGSGISQQAAKKLLKAGVSGIDVAGAGGTNWAKVEMLRNKSENNPLFYDWGIPTSFCLRKTRKYKKKYKFTLIGSGGIHNGMDAAKAFAMGADIVASARIILQELYKNDTGGVKNLIINWFDTVRKVMFLTGAHSIFELQKTKLFKKEKLY